MSSAQIKTINGLKHIHYRFCPWNSRDKPDRNSMYGEEHRQMVLQAVTTEGKHKLRFRFDSLARPIIRVRDGMELCYMQEVTNDGRDFQDSVRWTLEDVPDPGEEDTPAGQD